MAGLLKELMAAGLIEEAGGDDSRMQKMEKAAAAVCQDLIAKPATLIGAILAGVDPDTSDDDPALALADQAFLSVWKTMRNVYPSTPTTILRAILLEACHQATNTKHMYAILWLTTVDTLPLVRLGKQELLLRKMLDTCATRTEEAALVLPKVKLADGNIALNVTTTVALTSPASPKIDRNALLLQVAGAAGKDYARTEIRDQILHRHQYQWTEHPNTFEHGNPHWPNEGRPWSYEFTDRMTTVVANALDAMAGQITQQLAKAGQELQTSHASAVKALSTGFSSQQQWVQETIKTNEARQQAEKLRLDALWWSEALYSAPLRCSYRELPVELASMVMAIDLLSVVKIPTPASLGYLLAETVHRLPGAAFDQKRPLRELLVTLREQRKDLQDSWRKQLSRPPRAGRLSLRDAIVSAMVMGDWDAEVTFARAGIANDISMSLPVLSRALFRQEQAVRLAGGER